MNLSKSNLRRLLALALVALCAAPTVFGQDKPAAAKPTLFAYVGAGIRKPVDKLIADFERQTGIKVQATYANSGTLLAQLSAAKTGDLFIPGAQSFIDKAKAMGLIDSQTKALGWHVPVLVVPAGNPAKITGVKDLARPGVQVVLPDLKATALGMSAAKIFAALGIADAVQANVLSYCETPDKVVLALKLGQGQVGIVDSSLWQANRDKLELIEIDPAVNNKDGLPCAVLSCSGQIDAARAFRDFAAANGPAAFVAFGFRPEGQ